MVSDPDTAAEAAHAHLKETSVHDERRPRTLNPSPEQAWCWWTDFSEEALGEVRVHMGGLGVPVLVGFAHVDHHRLALGYAVLPLLPALDRTYLTSCVAIGATGHGQFSHQATPLPMTTCPSPKE